MQGTRAAIYVRVSTTGQEEDGTSLDSQEERSRSYCADRGYVVTEVYREVFTGKLYRERPALTRLRDASRRGDVDVVVAYALDRLSRNQTHLAVILDEIEHNGARLELVTETIEDSPIGRFVLNARAFAAELEREKIVERATRGQRSRVEGGKLLGSPRPLYGYQYRDATRGSYDIDPIKGPIVRRIYREALEGRSLRSIAMGLTADGILTPTGRTGWSHTAINGILKHPNYTGEAFAFAWRQIDEHKTNKFDHEHAIRLPDGTVPALVDRGTWDAVQTTLRRNQERSARNNRNPQATLLRGGYARCGYCGRAMRVSKRTDRHGATVYNYQCNKVQDPVRPCTFHSIDVSTLDGAIWRWVTNVLTDPRLIEEQVARVMSEQRSEGDAIDVERSIVKVERQQEITARSIAMLDDVDAASPLVAELSRLADRKRSLQREADMLRTNTERLTALRSRMRELSDWCQIVATNISEPTYEQKRTALDALGVTVSLFRHDHEPRYTIEANIPVSGYDCGQNTEEFLGEHGIAYTRRNYFRDRFSVDELRQMLASAGTRPVDVLSTRSKAYKARQDELDAQDDDGLLRAMVEEPTLIRRPLVIAGGKMVSGYDREQLQSLVDREMVNGQD